MLQTQPIVMSMVLPVKQEKTPVSQDKTVAETVAHIIGIKDISK